MEPIFTQTKKDPQCRARTGVLKLPHGTVQTPVFMPVGTNATVKAISVDSLKEIGFDIILSNTYHLFLRPGTEIIGAAGGLHAFMNWNSNILTDSGGFQVFSLAPFRKISEEGVQFRSHIDGSKHLLSPEKVVEIQSILGSDIQMQLDVCTSYGTEYKAAEKALQTTDRWLRRAKTKWLESLDPYQGKLFGIVQGNFYEDLRKQSVELLLESDTPGIAIGGLSVGEPFDEFCHYLAYTASLLPDSKPRYVMGIGTPEFILEAIEHGIDMFDCVFPTRTARNGQVFTSRGPLSIKKEDYKTDFSPLDPTCSCKVCQSYSRAYIRHLYKAGEILCSMLCTYHNLYFLKKLVKDATDAITEGRYQQFKKNFLAEYKKGN